MYYTVSQSELKTVDFTYFFSFLISISIYFLFLNLGLEISIDVICDCYKLLHDVTWYYTCYKTQS